jgi:16S rRNA (guanine527-N7)-methyltransferase
MGPGPHRVAVDTPNEDLARKVAEILEPWLADIRTASPQACSGPEPLSDKALAWQLGRFCAVLEAANRQLNLTGITDPHGMAVRHVLDSLSALPLLDGSGLVADLGTGGGLPGIPLALAQPQRRFALVESRMRKAAALKEMVDLLGLAPRIEVVHARAENWLAEHSADVLITRALGSVSTQLKMLSKVRSSFRQIIMLKGPGADEDLASAQKDMERWHFEAPQRVKLDLPDAEGQRVLLIFAGAGA